MIRKANVEDIPQIQALINKFAGQDRMLPRSLNELYENIRDFWVYEERGKITGCAALHFSWKDLSEIKSLAVEKNKQRRGIGAALARTCLEEAKRFKTKKVFVLTYEAGFFKKLGFKRIKNSMLPHKIWAECINCPKFPNCKEVAMVKII
jgi:amino-acid N-acetyltransferase